MIVYPYLKDDFLKLCASQEFSLESKKRILKDVLRGLAALHTKDFVHTGEDVGPEISPDINIVTDIKPNNILLDWEPSHDRDIVVKRVQIADVEDACYVPPGRTILGTQVGNWMWRSPEAHAQGPVNKSSDMFSFGLVVSLRKSAWSLGLDDFCMQPCEQTMTLTISVYICNYKKGSACSCRIGVGRRGGVTVSRDRTPDILFCRCGWYNWSA